MDNCCISTCSTSSSSSSSKLYVYNERVTTEILSDEISAFICNFFHVMFTLFLAIVGATMGAIIGACIELNSFNGLFRGAIVGAMAGSFFPFHFYTILLAHFRSDDIDTNTTTFLWLFDATAELARRTLHVARFLPPI